MAEMTEYKRGVRDTMYRISNGIERTNKGFHIDVDHTYFLKPLSIRLTIEKCWILLKKQILDNCSDNFDCGDER